MTPDNTAPEQIWLIPDTIEGFDLDGAIWGLERASENDVEYIRADLRPTPPASPQIWGIDLAKPGEDKTVTTTFHKDDLAVDRFAAAMKSKLKHAREVKHRGGWETADCEDDFLAFELIDHLTKANKGTFEDIANYAMMLHQRGTSPHTLAATFHTYLANGEFPPEVSEERALEILKSKGCEIYEGLPDFTTMNAESLRHWHTKMSAWGIDQHHAKATAIAAIESALAEQGEAR